MANKKLAKKKKVWFTLVAPEEYGKIELGKTIAKDEKSVIGRTIETTSEDLAIRGSREQRIKVILKVEKLKDNKALTFVKEINVSNTLIPRLMRANSDKIESSKVYELADGKKAKVKVFLLTKSTTHRPQRADAKKYLEDNIKRIVSKYSYEKLVLDALQNKLQKLMSQGLNKIIVIKRLLIGRIKLV